ncbi:hypothetical protein [Lacinutrix sp. Hel_I_90]|uniref:hypothetical protein n=1 Tax=Lacinutrix sp. Hel_I_90 TaxID=1249999 RepID=UPI0005C9B1B9|nr:hypothetical protein [Lacinutrix sp. Hel_I_90]
MLKHKSFIIKSAKNPKTSVRAMRTETPHPLEPELATNQQEKGTSGHYDKNEKIELVLPQSLSYDHDDTTMSHAHSYDSQQQKQAQESPLDYEEVSDENNEDYSAANAYFEKEDNFVKQQSNEQADASKKTNTPETATSNNEAVEAHDAVVVNSEDLLDEEAIREQDKKFEEDIKSILTGKKQFDKQRVAKDPEEAIKDKNHGLFDKNDNQKIEDKLKNDHAIFDKIAQSMEMASSYDLGSIAMDKKFDFLEKETDKEFTKKIHELLEEDKPKDKEATESNERVVHKTEKKEEPPEDSDKIETKDFLNDLDKLNTIEANHKKEVLETLSSQSSFNSTISIKHRYLKSRVFAVSGSTVEVQIDSSWTPLNCSTLNELNVTLTRSVDYWPDDEKGTKQFRIGGPDTKTWNDLESGNYYLTFFFVNNTNPNCELTGTIAVKA